MNPLNFFAWIRAKVREAVLLGFADAAEDLDGTTVIVPAALPEPLRLRLTQLPPPAEPTEPEEAPQSRPQRNGKK